MYKRILLKISGEVFMGERSYGIDPLMVNHIASEIKDVFDWRVEIALVVGGGNILRGVEAMKKGIDRASADWAGMLATIQNGLFLQNAFEGIEVPSRLMSAIEIHQIAESYIQRKAISHLEKKRVVIFAGGTGNPYFTTDTAAALRASEIGAEVVLKATKVEGVYTKDPFKEKEVERFEELTYLEFLKRNLKVMDATAISFCMENKLPIIIFNVRRKGNIKRVVLGEKIGTIIRE